MDGQDWREEYKYGPHLRKMVLIPGGLLGGGGGLGIWWAMRFGGRDGKLVCCVFGKEDPRWLWSISWLWTVLGKGWYLLYLVFMGQKFSCCFLGELSNLRSWGGEAWDGRSSPDLGPPIMVIEVQLGP